MTVWAVNDLGSKIDLSSASAYGDIEFVNRKYVYPDELNGDFLPDDVLANMDRVVDTWDIDGDYLLIAGDHLQLVAMSGLLAARVGIFNVLRYDRQAGGYLKVIIDTIRGEDPL